ncbi:hypothetical protein U1Q18_006696, partial [Sarracenia purpurea var. burkii]
EPLPRWTSAWWWFGSPRTCSAGYAGKPWLLSGGSLLDGIAARRESQTRSPLGLRCSACVSVGEVDEATDGGG